MSAKWEPTRSGVLPRPVRPYTGASSALTREDKEFFHRRYGLCDAASYIKRGDGRYLLDIIGPTGLTRGTVARVPWPGSPLVKETGAPVWPKAVTYMVSATEPVQSIYRSALSRPYPVVVLVEDQLSALVLREIGYDSVALLGVPHLGASSRGANGEPKYTGQDRVAEIAQYARGRPVIVALDADATQQAFLFARRWASAFSALRVAILERDLKDTPPAQIPPILGTVGA